MQGKSWEGLFRLFLFVISGLILSQLTTLMIASFYGYNFERIKELGDQFMIAVPGNLLKWSLLSSHLLTFIIPGFLFAYLYQKEDLWVSLQLKPNLRINYLGISAMILIFSYPAVSFSYTVNSWIPLADWMKVQEASTMTTMAKVLEMEHIGGLLFSLLLVSVVPGIGEELIFRGFIQRIIAKGTNNGHLAVWISAVLFSGFHLQFEGFLPRLFLGLILGYTYLYTKNLWVPIILHILNNAVPILSLYFLNNDLATLDPSASDPVPWYIGLISLILGISLIIFLKKITEKDERT